MRSLIAFLLSTVAAAAQSNLPVQSGETALTRVEVIALTTDATLVFYDNGQSKFSTGGAYSYTYANDGGTAFGVYRIAPDGVVCIDYRNGRTRCDRYVRSRDRIVMVTETGDRYPIRP